MEESSPKLQRDPSRGYCLTAPLPFVIAPIVLAVRGWVGWRVFAGGLVVGLAGYLVGSLVAFLLLEHSRVVRTSLGDATISIAASLMALVFALFAPS